MTRQQYEFEGGRAFHPLDRPEQWRIGTVARAIPIICYYLGAMPDRYAADACAGTTMLQNTGRFAYTEALLRIAV